MKVVSYNILANSYIKLQWYPHVPTDVLAWDMRGPRLIEQLVELDAEIMCLQEVEDGVFTELFCVFKPLGYQGMFARKGFGRPDGCALFFKESALAFCGGKTIYYNDQSSNERASGHVALIAKLEWEGTIYGVVCTHIRWDRADKSMEEHQGYRQVVELVEHHLSDFDVDEWIICGDFNAEEASPIIQKILQAGYQDAYSRLKSPTMNKEGLVRIDYIFYTAGLIASPVSIAPLSETECLPSKEQPSDHLPIAAAFCLSKLAMAT